MSCEFAAGLLVLDEAPSTNRLLMEQVARGEPMTDGAAVMARRQTAGRGRRGRDWFSGEGNLALSVAVSVAGVPLADVAQLSFVAAVAVHQALSRWCPTGLALKWPNDLLLSGAKVAGILLECEKDWVILGVGVNVAVAPAPEMVQYRATSLHAAGATEALAQPVAEAFLADFADWVQIWRQQGASPILAAWKQRAKGIGEPVVVRRLQGPELHGVFVDLDTDGALMLETEGTVQRVLAGDVFFPAA